MTFKKKVILYMNKIQILKSVIIMTLLSFSLLFTETSMAYARWYFYLCVNPTNITNYSKFSGSVSAKVTACGGKCTWNSTASQAVPICNLSSNQSALMIAKDTNLGDYADWGIGAGEDNILLTITSPKFNGTSCTLKTSVRMVVTSISTADLTRNFYIPVRNAGNVAGPSLIKIVMGMNPYNTTLSSCSLDLSGL